MADNSVAAGINPPPAPNALGTLSSILGLQQQRQQLQIQAQELESKTAAATVAQQGAKETQAAAQLLQDPVGNGLIDADGNPTKDAQSIVMRSMPTTGSTRYQQIVDAAKSKVEFNTSVNNLNASERQESGSMFAGAAAGARTPADIKDAADAFLAQKEGTPNYNDFKKIVDTSMGIINHQGQQQAARGQIVPTGQEAWRQAALGVGRTVLGAAGVVGAGGIGNPAQSTNAAGQNQLANQITGARSMPALGPGATNPGTPAVAGATTQATGAAGIDVERANQVSAQQQQSSGLIPLTKEIDRLSHEISSSKIAGVVSSGLKDLGYSDINQARTQLNKDLGLVQGTIVSRAGSDARAAEILKGYPTDATPEQTTHAAMDYIRGTLRQNVARGKLLQKHGIPGFQSADDILTRSTNPLMHEYLSLKPDEQAGFYRRNFSTPQQAQAFKNEVNAVKKHTSVLEP